MVLKKVLHSGQQMHWHRSKTLSLTMSVFYEIILWVCVMWKMKQIIKSKQYKWKGEFLNMKCCTWDKKGWLQYVDYQEFAIQYRSYKTWFSLFIRHFVCTYNLKVLISGWSLTQTIRSISIFHFSCYTWDMFGMFLAYFLNR